MPYDYFITFGFSGGRGDPPLHFISPTPMQINASLVKGRGTTIVVEGLYLRALFVFTGGRGDPPLHFLSSTFIQHNNASLVKGRCRVYEAEGLFDTHRLISPGGHRDPPLQLLISTLVFVRVVEVADPYNHLSTSMLLL